MKSDSMLSAAAPRPAHAEESPATVILVRPWKQMARYRGLPTLRYLTRTEAHTFAFSVAANAVLSFFPFMVLLMWLVRNVRSEERRVGKECGWGGWVGQ